MKLQTIFDQLIHGELSQLFIGGAETSDVIVPDNYPKVISYINMGLLELYKRFPLRLKELVIQQNEGIGTYILDSNYAVANNESSEPIRYIIDSVSAPFNDAEFLVIECVYDELGCELVLNDSSDPKSLFTPAYNELQIPNPVNTSATTVTYRATHGLIPQVTTIIPETQEVNLPYSLLLPLCTFVGARAYAGSTTLNGVDEAQKQMIKYESECLRITDLSLVNYDVTPNLKLSNNGWV